MKINVIERTDAQNTTVDITCRTRDEHIERLVDVIRLESDVLCGRGENGEVRLLNPGQIYYVESVDGRCYIYLESETYRTDSRLCELEEKLPSYSFVRASKSMIVNLRMARSLEPESGRKLRMIMKNDEIVVISRQYAAELKHKLKI